MRTSLVGRKFERLLVVEELQTGTRNRKFRCICDCGAITTPWYSGLTSGRAKSCGCLMVERVTSHGLESHPLYPTWRNMVSRCTRPEDRSWPRYGGRGISVCHRWKTDMQAFLDDMGPRPEGCSLDRIDNSGDYTPSNCRWATNVEQARNKRNNVWVRGRLISDWATELGVSLSVISGAVAKGRTHEQEIDRLIAKGSR